MLPVYEDDKFAGNGTLVMVGEAARLKQIVNPSTGNATGVSGLPRRGAKMQVSCPRHSVSGLNGVVPGVPFSRRPPTRTNAAVGQSHADVARTLRRWGQRQEAKPIPSPPAKRVCVFGGPKMPTVSRGCAHGIYLAPPAPVLRLFKRMTL